MFHVQSFLQAPIIQSLQQSATYQHVSSPWCWTFPAVAIGRAPQRRRAAKAAQPVPPVPAWMTTTSPWTTRPKSMAAAKVLGAFPRCSRYPATRNVADSANFTTKDVGKRNLKESEKGKHLQTALSQGHKMSEDVLSPQTALTRSQADGGQGRHLDATQATWNESRKPTRTFNEGPEGKLKGHSKG